MVQVESHHTANTRNRKPTGYLEQGLSPRIGGATFSRRHRALRLLWSLCWLLFARWTPAPFQPLRRALLVLFGAEIHPTAMVRGSARVWWPGNLKMGARAMLGPGVNCYNIADVVLADFAIVSQRAHLCTASHDIDDELFALKVAPIILERETWVATEAFIGPGVTVSEGAVLAARAVAVRDLDPWTVYAGNPAMPKRKRRILS